MSEVLPIPELLGQVSDQHRYHEFLRAPAMSAGVYVLSADATDTDLSHRTLNLVVIPRSFVAGGREGDLTSACASNAVRLRPLRCMQLGASCARPW